LKQLEGFKKDLKKDPLYKKFAYVTFDDVGVLLNNGYEKTEATINSYNSATNTYSNEIEKLEGIMILIIKAP
jgi:hypothetical protein